jgi:hypothetical protein
MDGNSNRRASSVTNQLLGRVGLLVLRVASKQRFQFIIVV